MAHPLNYKIFAVSVYIDFREILNKVHHTELLGKLTSLGIGGKLAGVNYSFPLWWDTGCKGELNFVGPDHRM